jgi:hypothetical protein
MVGGVQSIIALPSTLRACPESSLVSTYETCDRRSVSHPQSAWSVLRRCFHGPAEETGACLGEEHDPGGRLERRGQLDELRGGAHEIAVREKDRDRGAAAEKARAETHEGCLAHRTHHARIVDEPGAFIGDSLGGPAQTDEGHCAAE